MRRVVLGALVGVVLTALPGSAGWSTSGTATGTAAAAVLTAVEAPAVSTSCLADGSLGVSASWTPTGDHVTGYELWRVRDGVVELVTTVPATTTSASDLVPLGMELAYFVVSWDSAWSQTSAATTLPTGLCTVG